MHYTSQILAVLSRGRYYVERTVVVNHFGPDELVKPRELCRGQPNLLRIAVTTKRAAAGHFLEQRTLLRVRRTDEPDDFELLRLQLECHAFALVSARCKLGRWVRHRVEMWIAGPWRPPGGDGGAELTHAW